MLVLAIIVALIGWFELIATIAAGTMFGVG